MEQDNLYCVLAHAGLGLHNSGRTYLCCHSRKYLEINIGDKVSIYMKRKANQKSHVSLGYDVSYEVEEISIAHGITFYKNFSQRQT
jgi:hypothetical protein